MVYESDFYTTRRPYSSRPNVSSYSSTTPRYYNVSDASSPRKAEQQYLYSYKSESSTTRNSAVNNGRPETSAYSATHERKSASGPGGYNYTTERKSTSGSRPGDYSYSSSTSGILPGSNTYRNYSYRV